MNLRARKILYLLLMSGVLVLVVPLLVLLGASLKAVLAGEIESSFFLAISIAGAIGLGSGFYTLIALPVSSLAKRLLLSLGIVLGTMSIIGTLTESGTPAFLQSDLPNLLKGSYIWFGPVLVGIALLIELWVLPVHGRK
jgi:hypothetical protein